MMSREDHRRARMQHREARLRRRDEMRRKWFDPQRWGNMRLLHSRIQRRIFAWMVIVMLVSFFGARWIAHMNGAKWWTVIPIVMVVGMASGAIAWRFTMPLLAVIDAARKIGDGELSTRIKSRRHHGELVILADAINDMAARIERQIADQRELLAAVSHELRTPLGHMRILIETERERAAAGADTKRLDELEAEIARLDDLVGRLLASSRLDFGQLDRRPVDVGALAADVATQAKVAADKITADDDTRADVDPTLVRRALANLIENARVHGGGAIAVRVEGRGDDVALEVDDAGPGVPEERRADAGKPFVPSKGGGLGLGLSLVHRIAAAHGGRAWIVDRPGGGARVGFALPRVAPAPAEGVPST